MRKKKSDFKDLYHYLGRSWGLIKSEKKMLFFCLFCSLFLCLLSVITPLLMATLLLRLTDGLLQELIVAAFFVLGVELSKNLFNFLNSIILQKYLMKTVSFFQIELAKETLKLETYEIDQKSSGVFIDRLNNDTREIVNIFTRVGDVFIDLLSNIGVLIAIFLISKVFFFYFLIVVFLIFGLERIRLRKQMELDKERRKLNEKNTGLTGELVRGLRDLRVLNAEHNFMDIAEDRLLEANQTNYRISKVRASYSLLISSVRDFCFFLFIVLGVFLVSHDMLTIANFVIIYMYRSRVLGVLQYYSVILEMIKQFNLAAGRVFAIIDGEDFDKEKFGSKKLPDFQGKISFQNVSFSYHPDSPVLKDVTFSVEPNHVVSFVGKSGSGKSTIFSLLMRLYKVSQGTILVDGVPLSELSKDTLRGNFVMIPQSPYIFHLSVRDNLLLVQKNATEEELIEACKSAQLHDFIMSLPDGYDTLLGEGGLTLSGGERQRLAIARAFLRKAKVVLFDEATSSLDNETQDEIQKAIQNLKEKCTVLIIAHRLSTVVDSDLIYVIEKGKVIASGTHKQLLKDSKEYKKLYEKDIRESSN